MTPAPRARKRFGQHFLTDPGIVSNIVHAIAPAADDCLVEIGPGRGAITAPLARLAGHLHLVEFDRDLVRGLHAQYDTDPRVTVHEADALGFDFGRLGNELRIVGNLPYNISTPLLFHLVEYREHVRDMHFMLQKEVVRRMSAAPGSKAYGRLTVMLACHLEVVPLFDVTPAAFAPPPQVDSSVVRLTPLPRGHFRIVDPPGLARLVRQGFSQRRKTLHNALAPLAGDEDLRAAGIDPAARAERVPVAAWIELANRLAAH
ncbi:MAG TPA: 16S rRNA (adenine(1518)-N(6)/adenine(1519)-N(6))-dimethyltransferase RsmA [Woeseiaceae bacterium]|nr:16S rRNA (adenine(1518)-N(6)/adenine(1519)-N(6))-dimethyltransferase RsmA [Woeseiaceae bacterium]